MPATDQEQAALAQLPPDELDHRRQTRDDAPVHDNLIKNWEVVALMLNRSIGSGIFLVPANVLAATGCVGGSLILWILGSLISLSGLFVWLICCFSMPQHKVGDEAWPRGIPRSGGELNFLQFMFAVADPEHAHPHLRVSCSFGIMFILMYNLSGNAIAFAIEVLVSLGYYNPASPEAPDRRAVLPIDIAILSVIIACHIFSRRGGIWINNAFAAVKVLMLVLFIIFGIAYSCGRLGGSGAVAKGNYTHGFFQSPRSDASSWSNALLLCTYTYSGGDQPFYVLAETKSPRKTFPRYIVIGWAITTTLFLGLNFVYFLVVRKSDILSQDADLLAKNIDMATLFLRRIFADHKSAERAMSALIAVCIAGNLWVMTFTAARVKQEIAKEGVLQPVSLRISTAYKTPWGLIREFWYYRVQRPLDETEIDRAPVWAFVLHWFSSVILVAAISPITDPRKSYYVLVSLFGYTMVALVGLWVCIGLLVIQFRKSTQDWQNGRRYTPPLWPVYPIFYGVATAFIVVGAFVPPKLGSPFHHSVTGLPYYLVPVIGSSAPFWGTLWYGVLRVMRPERILCITRAPRLIPDPYNEDEYIKESETIDQSWERTHRRGRRENGPEAQADNGPALELPLLRRLGRQR